eukprot:TRINITY_DN65816_c9_g1_i1.p1 TRINITY_DN65816_c9_g1~~TRINITY_DN65816_c9_g1_i1.p1  ORF type:complete len:505 (-),score=235.78 TRINITY_DN65816_c9_g1_i1:1162-2676(-)
MSSSPSEGVDFGKALVDVLKSISTVYIMGGAGTYLYRKGMLSEAGVRDLSRIMLHYLYPALVFRSCVQVFSIDLFLEVWFLVVICLLHIVCCMGVGFVAMNMLGRVPRHFKRVVMAAIGFSNALDIPVAMIYSIAGADIFDGTRTAGGELETVEDRRDRGIAYISLYAGAWVLVSFTFLWEWLVPPDVDEFDEKLGDGAMAAVALTSLPKHKQSSSNNIGKGHSQEEVGNENDHVKPQAAAVRVARSPAHSTRIDEAQTAVDMNVEFLRKLSSWEIFKLTLAKVATNPVAMATVLGLVCGLVTPIRAIFARDSEDEDEPPLDHVMNILQVIGRGAVPMSMVVIGANVGNVPMFARRRANSDNGDSAGTEDENEDDEDRKSEDDDVKAPAQANSGKFVDDPHALVTQRVVLIVIVARMVCGAIISIGLAMPLYHLGLIPQGDRLLLFVCMIPIVTPTATAVVVISTLLRSYQEQLSVIVFWEYVAAVILLPISALVIILLVGNAD